MSSFLFTITCCIHFSGLPWWVTSKESTCNAEVAGNRGLIPESGSCPGGAHGNALQYSCLENPTDRRAWWTTVHNVIRVGHDWSEWARIVACWLLCPWDFPGKNTGMGCHFLLWGSSWPRDGTHVSSTAGRFFTPKPSGKRLN